LAETVFRGTSLAATTKRRGITASSQRMTK
jgi:hypothetical protein